MGDSPCVKSTIVLLCSAVRPSAGIFEYLEYRQARLGAPFDLEMWFLFCLVSRHSFDVSSSVILCLFCFPALVCVKVIVCVLACVRRVCFRVCLYFCGRACVCMSVCVHSWIFFGCHLSLGLPAFISKLTGGGHFSTACLFFFPSSL